MQTYRFSELSEEKLSTLVALNKIAGVSEDWEKMQEVSLTSAELGQIDYLRSIWYQRHLSVMNEATVWARYLPDASPRRTGCNSSVGRRSTESCLSQFPLGR